MSTEEERLGRVKQKTISGVCNRVVEKDFAIKIMKNVHGSIPENIRSGSGGFFVAFLVYFFVEDRRYVVIPDRFCGI